jgi:2-aminoadipate transaminase
MTFTISNKMNSLKPSIIREIFKYAADPAVITLAAGSPAPEALPVEAISRMMGAVLNENPNAALQYSQSEGHPPFVAKLREFLTAQYGVIRDDDRILVTSGAQQCMDLVTKVLCNEGDTIICEEPSFIGSLNCFRSYGAKLVGVPLESDGIDINKLEDALKTNTNVRFIYVIPNFQNPTGITMSMAKRKAVYELARKYDVAILEDNPYGDLRFTGEPLPAIKTLDGDGRVFYAGTFSKILSPGIRVGYLVAPEGAYGRIVVGKQCADVHTSMLAQLLCQRFLEETDVPAHLKNISVIYAHKCELMLGELARQMPASVTWTRPEGGLFIWAKLPAHIDSADFATRLVKEKKVCVVPGTAFGTIADAPSSAIRLNFSTPTDENIVRGVTAVAELLREMV